MHKRPVNPISRLYLDFDSFFATVEQHLNPALRGLPVGVVPLDSPNTGCIAISREAKSLGVKSMVSIAEARRIVPDMIFVVARHDVYVRLHNRIIDVINTVVPVAHVRSIDEVVCHLLPSEARDCCALANQIKKALATAFSPVLTCSIGMASTELLAKIGAEANKPDGFALIEARDLPERLAHVALIYHGVREDYPYASDRLHYFLLHASRDFQQNCAMRRLRCVIYVEREGRREKGLVYRLAESAVAVLTDDHPVFVARAQANRFAAKCERPVFAVDTARLVPTQILPDGLNTTPAFRKASGALRAEYEAHQCDFISEVPPHDGSLCFADENLGAMTDDEITAIIADCDIDHSLPPALDFTPTTKAALAALDDFVANRLKTYPYRRNNPAEENGVSRLSPYLHFGLIGPRKITAAVRASDVPAKSKWKYLDELLTWREYFHYQAYRNEVPDSFETLPEKPRLSLLAHAEDERPVLYTLSDLVHGRTEDETWNAAQRQWLETGYMHNNLRMYWGKQIIKWTRDPETAWKTACYLNDRLALDGRDPATYGNMKWVFGMSKPSWREQPIYGWVPANSDRAIRKRDGATDWLTDWATRDIVDIDVPAGKPEDVL